jgi:hypothetical protein
MRLSSLVVVLNVRFFGWFVLVRIVEVVALAEMADFGRGRLRFCDIGAK